MIMEKTDKWIDRVWALNEISSSFRYHLHMMTFLSQTLSVLLTAASQTLRRHQSVQLFCPLKRWLSKLSFCPEDYCFDALFTTPIFRVLSPALKGSQILTVCALTQAESQYPLSVCIKDTSSRPVEGLAAGQWAHVWRQQWKQTKDRKWKNKG